MKIAVLGAGGMGATVIGHLKECPEVAGVVAYDVRPQRLRELETQHVEVTDDLDAVLRDRAIALVFVTASSDAHHALTVQSLRAGKAVLCEKPMATTWEDAQAMVAAAEESGGFLQIGFELRYSKLYTQVKAWIEAGLLGEIVNTQCTYVAGAWAKNLARTSLANGSMFGEKLSHYVDLPRWWIGSPVRDVYAACAPNLIPYLEVRDNYHATYRFESGAVSHLTFLMGPAATFRGDPQSDIIAQQIETGHALRFRVVGTRGAAETDVFGRRLKRWEFGDAPESFISDVVETLSWTAEQDHLYFHNTREQTRDVVRRVQSGLPPRTSPRDALETTRLCFAADQSAQSGQVVRLMLDPNSL